LLGRSGQRSSRCHRHHHGDSAAIRVWGRHVASASTHGPAVSTRCQKRTVPGPTQRKKRTTPLLGVVCLLTTGGLPRNGSSGVTVPEESPRACGPTHRPTPWPDASSSGLPGRGRVVQSPPSAGAQRPCRASASRQSSGRADARWRSSPSASPIGLASVGRRPPGPSDGAAGPTRPAAARSPPGWHTASCRAITPGPLRPGGADSARARMYNAARSATAPWPARSR
jgi:hypothetical protein